jgi:integrase
MTYWDEPTGFGVRLSQGGSKSFILVYRKGERRQRITLGRYPDLSLADARAEAKRILAMRTLGTHPTSTISFNEIADQFLESQSGSIRPRTLYDYKRILNAYFRPNLGSKPLADISTSDVASIIDGLLPTKHQCNYAFAVIRALFRWAIARRVLARSPLEGMAKPAKTQARERVLDHRELKAVYLAATSVGAFGKIVRLCILTGQRRSEIGALQWDHIDSEKKTITLPASLTKNGRAHTFPYGDMVAAIFEDMKPPGQTATGFLFPSEVPGKSFVGWGNYKPRIDRVLTGVSHWTLHDLRRTFATNLAALGTPIHVTEKLLNHVSGTTGGIVAIYQRHAYMDEMRAAIDAWEARLASLLNS